MEQKDFVASVFKTFSLDLSTLPSRIAFQKTVYLLQELGLDPDFHFRWHNFGPYSSGLARIGFSINEVDSINAPLLVGNHINEFKGLVQGHIRDSRFLEMMADIVFIKKNMGVTNEKKIFLEVINHSSYLEDKDMFNLAIERLSRSNLI